MAQSPLQLVKKVKVFVTQSCLTLVHCITNTRCLIDISSLEGQPETETLRNHIPQHLRKCCPVASRVRLFETPWTAAYLASLSFTVSRSLLKLMSIESVRPFNHLILSCPVLLLPSIFPSIKVFSNESALCISWPKYWSSNN